MDQNNASDEKHEAGESHLEPVEPAYYVLHYW